MQQAQLYPLIREEVKRNLNGYVLADEIVHDIENYIVAPILGTQSGLCGALALGIRAWQDSQS